MNNKMNKLMLAMLIFILFSFSVSALVIEKGVEIEPSTASGTIYYVEENLTISNLNVSGSSAIFDNVTLSKIGQGTVNIFQINIFIENSTGGAVTNYNLTCSGTGYSCFLNNGTSIVSPAENISYTITHPSLATTYENLTIINTTENYTIVMAYYADSIDIEIRDEITKELIDNANISIEFISDAFSFNYTTTNGTLHIDFIPGDDYDVRYYGDDYGRKRDYFFEFSDQTHNNLTLYLLNDSLSEDVVINVYDADSLAPLPNAYVYGLRYDQSTNTYDVINIYKTDINGNNIWNLEANNEYYKFMVDLPLGDRKLITENMYVTSGTINLYVNLIETIGEEYFDRRGIVHTITYDNSSHKFIATYTDAEAIATEYCVKLQTYGAYGITTINYTCSSNAAGSLEVSGMDINSSQTYYAVIEATIEGQEYVLGSEWTEFLNSDVDTGSFGLFMTVIIIILFSFMSSFGVVSAILAMCGLVFAKLLSLIAISWGLTFTLIMAGVMLAMLMESRK